MRTGRCHDPQGRLETAKYDTYDMDLHMILFALFCFDLQFGFLEQVCIYIYTRKYCIVETYIKQQFEIPYFHEIPTQLGISYSCDISHGIGNLA